MSQNNTLTLDDLQIAPLTQDNIPEQKDLKPKTTLSLDDLVVSDIDIGETRPLPSAFISQQDYTTDYQSFDFLRIGADNEEIRAKRQSGWDLAKGAATQTAGMAIGGVLSGFGYIADLFTDLPNRMQGDEVEFNNLLTQWGEGLQEWTQQVAPVYQTRRAQQGGVGAALPFINGQMDWTYWAGNAPTIASSLSIMIPGYAAMRGAAMAGRALRLRQAGQKLGEVISPRITTALNSRRAQGFIDHAGNTFLSRHVYNSLEANDVWKQEYEESLQKGLSDSEARSRAGMAAATMYRTGYMNIWKDALQWRIILGTRFGSQAARRPFTQGNLSVTDRRVVADLMNRFPEGIPRQAVRQLGIAGQKGKGALKSIAKLGLLEGFEEINIQHQKQLARNYIDDLNENIGEPITGWGQIYGTLMPNYLQSLAEFTYDPETIISDEAFDAAFWAFMSGATMGTVMRGAKPAIDRLTGSSQASTIVKNKAQFNYFREQAAAMQVAQMEGNQPRVDRIIDETIFNLTIAGVKEGTTHVDGAIAEGRLSDIEASLEQIIQADNETLENSGLPSDDGTRAMYERMYSDIQYIADRFDKHDNRSYGFSRGEDQALATYLTYYEYIQKRSNERLSQYESEAAELQSDINESAISEGYRSIIPLKIQQLGIQNRIDQAKQDISDIKKAKAEFTTDEARKQIRISELQDEISLLQERLKDYQDQINTNLEGIERSAEKMEAVDNLVNSQYKLVDLHEFMERERAELKNAETKLENLYTNSGRKKIINERRKNISENRNKEMQAAIEQVRDVEELERLDVSNYTNETKQLYNDVLQTLKARDRATREVNVPDIDQEYVDTVQSRVPHMDSQQFDMFVENVRDQDLHGNTKNAIINYAQEVFNKSRQAIVDTQAEHRIRDLKNELSQEHESLLKNVFAKSNLNDAMTLINKSDIDGSIKRQITEVLKHYHTKIEKKIPKEQREDIQEAKDTQKKRRGEDQTVDEFTVGTDKIVGGRKVGEIVTLQDVTNRHIQKTNTLQQFLAINAIGDTWDKVKDQPFIIKDLFFPDPSDNTIGAHLEYTGDINEIAIKSHRQELKNLYIIIKQGDLTAEDSVTIDEFTVEQAEDTSLQEADQKETPPLTATRAQYDYTKGHKQMQFEFKDGEITPIDRTDAFERNKDDVDFHQMSNPIVQEGDSVQLELLKNDWVNESKENQSGRKHTIAIRHPKIDKPIGIIRELFPENASEDQQSSIQAELDQRIAVVNALKQGKRVTANISKKLPFTQNINNIRIDGKHFLRSLKTIESNQFTKKEDGTIVQEDRPVILAVSEGVVEQGTDRLSIESDYYDFLPESVKQEINADLANQGLETADGVRVDGHVHIITLDPMGQWKALKATTRNLDQKAVDFAYDTIIEGDVDTANEIVHTRSNLNVNTRGELFLNISEDGNTIEYWDSSLGDIVKLERNEDRKGFTAYKRDSDELIENDEGILSFQYSSTPIKVNYRDGLKDLLSNKKYNIQRHRIGDTTTPYTSPLFPDKEFNSYYDFVTSEETVNVDTMKGQENYIGDTSAIVATDLYSDNGSFWSNNWVQLDINIQDSVPQKDANVRPSKEKPQTEFNMDQLKLDIQTPFMDAVQEQYKKHEKIFKESETFVTLEDFQKQAEQGDRTPKAVQRFAEAMVAKIKNNC